ncbi:MAG: hypothetical protein AAF750_16655 [Planctomycetota bacterium]
MPGKRRHPVRVWGEYLAARALAAGLTAVDLDRTLKVAPAVGRVMGRLDRKHAERAAINIRRAHPDWDEARVQGLVRACFENLAKFAAEVVHTQRAVTPDNWADRFEWENLEGAIARMASDRPVLMVTGHLGNWELLGYIMAVLGFDLDALARPLDNHKLNDWVLGMRERRGLRIITKWDATQRMLGVMERGGALGFVADQNAGGRGMFVPFMGKLASTYKSIGLLAMQHEASVVCGYAFRAEPTAADPRPFRYRIGVADIIDPEDWADRRDPLYYVTARFNRALESMVRSQPEQYLWMHRRWKARPRHEQSGKPMPKGLRRNLEELPWMTDELMASCSSPLEE